MLGDVVEDHLLRHGGEPLQPRLAEVPLDVVLRGIAETAVGLDGGVGGEERRVGGEELGDVGLFGVTPLEAAMMTSTVQARELGLHDRGRLAEGLLADVVVLDGDWRVRQTLIGGAVVYADDGA